MNRISRAHACGMAAAACLLLILASPASAKTCKWVGARADNNLWNHPPNWTDCEGTFPTDGDTADVPGGAVQNVLNVSIPNIRLKTILFRQPPAQGAWILTGVNTLTVNELIYSETTVNIVVPLKLDGNVSISQFADANRGVQPMTIAKDIALTQDRTITFRGSNAIELQGAFSNSCNVVVDMQFLPTATFTFDKDSFRFGTTSLKGPLIVFKTSHAFGTDNVNLPIVRSGTVLRPHMEFAQNPQALQLEDNVTFSIDETNATLSDKLVMAPDARLPLQIKQGLTLTLAAPIGTATGGPRISVTGGGTLMFDNPAGSQDKWTSLSTLGGQLRVSDRAKIPVIALMQLSFTTFPLFDLNVGLGPLAADAASTIHLGSGTLTINETTDTLINATVTGTGNLVKNGGGTMQFAGVHPFTGSTIVNGGILWLRGTQRPVVNGPVVINAGFVSNRGEADLIGDAAPVVIGVPGVLTIETATDTIGSLAGGGQVDLIASTLTVGANNTSTVFSGQINAINGTLVKIGDGALTMTGPSTIKTLGLDRGALVFNGTLAPAGTVAMSGGVLSGTGTVGTIAATGGFIAPGIGPGVLQAGNASMSAGALVIEMHGVAPGAANGYDQLALTGNLTLSGTAALQLALQFEPLKGSTFTIVNMAAGKTVTGIFNGLPEGAEIAAEQRHFSISYHGGDGNDIVLTSTDEPAARTYYLSEGATGGFFDEDILLANPNDQPAPVTLTFSKKTGEQVVATRTLAPQSRQTVHVEEIPGLEETEASTQVTSESGLPLIVERSMFWDASYYAGHTGGAVDRPEADWFFAEGSQGFFQTYVLVINPSATPADVTFTFLLENEAPVVHTVTLGASTRLTLDTGTIPGLVDRSFGIAVHATAPIMAERAMYFGSTPGRVWSGGHESAGVTAASAHWFLAEGATGGFFDTFVLLSNPQNADAHVTLQYLLDTGETITVPKTIAANARLTTNIETEEDVRLHAANVSTVVTSDVPIIAERSMYWAGVPWREGHNSFGVVDASTTWGLAEGRAGGPHAFHTYILLANPQTTAADVTIRYLRETGEPVTQTYAVPATSRVTVDVNAVDGLQESAFGAVITVTNNVPIIVERSLYWDAGGVQFSGGTNATGIVMP